MSDVLDIMALLIARKYHKRWDSGDARVTARNAIKALDAAGYQIVPKEPTEAMANCFKGSYSEGFAECMQPWERVKIYSAMLAAAKEEQNDERNTSDAEV